VRPASLPSVLPDKRAARRRLPSRGSLGPRCPTCPTSPRRLPALGTMVRSDSPLPRSGRCAWRSLPDTAPASRRSWCPPGARGRGDAPRSRQGLWSPGPPRRLWCPETGGSPTVPSSPGDDLPRSQPPVGSCALALPHQDCGLPAPAHRRRLPRYRCGCPAVHASPYFGAPSRGLPPRSRQLRTPLAGLARGVHF
jgi:hypothetical protein